MNKIVNYKSKDGTKLIGIVNANAISNKGCIIMCHGLKTDKEEYGDFKKLSELLLENYDSFRFDFRGHGQSEGKDIDITMQGLKEDLESSIIFIQNQGYEEIYILGASFGASILSLINYERFPKVKKLIMWSGSIDFDKGNPRGSLGYYNYKKAIEEGSVEVKIKTTDNVMKLSRTFMEETRSSKAEEKIKEIDVPILFIHGTEDETTPYQVNRQMAKTVKKSYFATIQGASHGFHEEKYIIMASKYIESFLNIKLPDKTIEIEEEGER